MCAGGQSLDKTGRIPLLLRYIEFARNFELIVYRYKVNPGLNFPKLVRTFYEGGINFKQLDPWLVSGGQGRGFVLSCGAQEEGGRRRARTCAA